MQIIPFDDAQALAAQSAARIRQAIEQKPDALFCFAAGRTQIPTYQILSQWARDGQLDASNVRVIGLDDIVGANPQAGEGFRYFLDTHLFAPAGFRPENIEFFQTRATNILQECRRIDAWLDANGPIDFLLLGIGLNGHIGYNEPGTPIDARSFVVEQLAQESMAVSRTYFDHDFDLNQGITLGLKDLLSAKTILVQATGSDKAPVIAALRSGKAGDDLPVSHLAKRPDVELYIDQAADQII